MHTTAERIIDRISDDAVRSEAYSALAKDYMDQGMHTTAERIIDRIG